MARQLNKLVQEFQEGKHEGSVLTVATVESLSLDEKQTWRAIRKELEDIGISVGAFDANKGFIMNWFHEALETGKFEEQNQECTDDGQQQELPDGPTTAAFQTPPRTEDSDRSSRDRDEATTMIYQEVKGNNTAQPPTSRPNPILEKPSVVSTELVRGYKKGRSDRRRPPKVALLVAWMLRYDEAFHTACINGRLDEAQLLLDKGANINSIVDDQTLLTFAASRNRIDLLRFLLAARADTELVNAAGRTPLHEAIHRNNVKPKVYYLANIKYLLSHGAKVDGLDAKNVTPFLRASNKGSSDAVVLLLKHGAKIPSEFLYDYPPESSLALAIADGDIVMTTILLDHGVSINSTIIHRVDRNRYEIMPILRYAIQCKQDEVALLIIKRGAVGTAGKRQIILHAIKHDCIQTLRHLVSLFPEAAAATMLNFGFRAPLAHAVEMRNINCCKILISGGAKLRETYLNERRGGFSDTKASSWDFLNSELQREPGKWPSMYPTTDEVGML